MYVCVCVVIVDSLWRWKVHVSVYCAHLRCTPCSIVLHHKDICFLTCICMWQISQIKTFSGVVRPGLASTSTDFMRSSARLDGLLAQKNNRAPIAGGRRGQIICPADVTSPPRLGYVA